MIGNPYKGRGFKGLLRYLYEGRRGEANPHRVMWTETRNLPSDKPDTVAAIMRATASLSKGVQKPVYHLPISWPPEEQLSKEVQMQVADQLVQDLGLSEHQHLVVAHDDGDCPHIHLVINTVNPDTGRVWNGWRDVYRIMESLERQEQELGLRIVDRPDLEDWRSGTKDPDKSRDPSRGERLRAEREDDTPLAKWSEADMRKLRKAITAHFKDATSWEDLETRLAAHGVHLRRAGQGFRITDGSHFMTMSKVGKHAREDKLEERFGETWEDYSFIRETGPAIGQAIEPPDVKKPETIQEHLDNLAAKQEADTRREKEQQVRHALQVFSKYHYYRTQEKQAAELGLRVVNERRALRANERAVATAERDFLKADASFDAMCETLYRNPKKARQSIDRQLREGKAFDEIDLISAGRVKGWRLLRWRTKARKEAIRTLERMPRAYDRLEKRRNAREVQLHQGLTLQARYGDTVEKFSHFKNVLGDHDQRAEKRLALWRDQNDAFRQIDQNDIWRSDLPEDAKEHLARGWEDHVQTTRARERGDLHGENAADRWRRRRAEEREDRGYDGWER